MTMSDFSPFDLAAALVVSVLALYGFFKGMIRLVLWFVGLALGWILAVRYCEPVAVWLGAEPAGSVPGFDVLRIVAFAIVLVAVVVITSLLGHLVTRILSAAKLRSMDRIAGAGLGMLAAILLICAATIPLVALSPPDGGMVMKESLLAPYAVAGGDYLKVLVPEPMRSRFTQMSRSVLQARR
jgi:uncharacterized membrane protein required for colicin V production